MRARAGWRDMHDDTRAQLRAMQATSLRQRANVGNARQKRAYGATHHIGRHSRPGTEEKGKFLQPMKRRCDCGAMFETVIVAETICEACIIRGYQ